MNSYETLEILTSLFVMGANVAVAGICFMAYGKRRVNAILLLAISASIAVFTFFADILLQKVYDNSTYAILWIGVQLMWVIDICLYALGVTRLVNILIKEKTEEQPIDTK
jgi:drug/metabolite transporter (DMT)-like permease